MGGTFDPPMRVTIIKKMMSVLQEIKGLTKELYFIYFTAGSPVSMQNCRSTVNGFTCFGISIACIIMYCQD